MNDIRCNSCNASAREIAESETTEGDFRERSSDGTYRYGRIDHADDCPWFVPPAE